MRAIFLSTVSAIILAGAVAVCLQSNSSAMQAASGGTIRISNDDLGDDSVLVSVLKSGAILKSSDCTASQMIEWENIQDGDYEVKFEAAGKQSLIKRIHIGAGDSTVLSAKLPVGKGTITMGGGPSLTDLDARLKKVEAVLVKAPAKPQKK